MLKKKEASFSCDCLYNNSIDYEGNVKLWVSFVMNFSGAKFEELCFNISRDILFSVFYHISCKLHDVTTFLVYIIQKCQYL